MKTLRYLLRFARRMLLGLAVLMFIQSLVRPVSFNSFPSFSMDYHAIGSFDGVIYWIDIDPSTDQKLPDRKWMLSDPPDQRLRHVRWNKLGFQYSFDVIPSRTIPTPYSSSPNVWPGYSAFEIAVPYWFLILFLGAAEVILVKNWFKQRAARGHPVIEPDADVAVVTDDLPCVHCGYSLKMQPGDSRCPECGAAVMDTLSLNAELARSRPAWLKWLAWGNLLLLSVRILVIGAFEAVFVHVYAPAGLLILVAGAAYIIGTWLLTLQEHPFLKSPERKGVRKQRGRAILSVALLGIGMLIETDYIPSLPPGRYALTTLFGYWRIEAVIAWMLAWVFFCFGTMYEYRFLATLAGRLLDRFMTEHCKIAGIGAACSGIAMLFCAPAIIGAWDALSSFPYFVVAVSIIVIWMLFVLWTGFMNLYCAIRFTGQAWRAENRWRRVGVPAGA